MVKVVEGFFSEEEGLGTVEIVIIIAVLVGVALVFRKQIFALVDQIFNRIFKSAGDSTSVQDSAAKSIE